MALDAWVEQVWGSAAKDLSLNVPEKGIQGHHKKMIWLALLAAAGRVSSLEEDRFQRMWKLLGEKLSLEDNLDSTGVLRRVIQMAGTERGAFFELLSLLLKEKKDELQKKPWIFPKGDVVMLWSQIPEVERWAYDLASVPLEVTRKKSESVDALDFVEQSLLSVLAGLNHGEGLHWKVFLWQNLLLLEARTGLCLPKVDEVLQKEGVSDIPISRTIRKGGAECGFAGGVELILKHFEHHPLLLKGARLDSGWEFAFRKAVLAREDLPGVGAVPGAKDLWKKVMRIADPSIFPMLESLFLESSIKSASHGQQRRRM